MKTSAVLIAFFGLALVCLAAAEAEIPEPIKPDVEVIENDNSSSSSSGSSSSSSSSSESNEKNEDEEEETASKKERSASEEKKSKEDDDSSKSTKNSKEKLSANAFPGPQALLQKIAPSFDLLSNAVRQVHNLFN